MIARSAKLSPANGTRFNTTKPILLACSDLLACSEIASSQHRIVRSLGPTMRSVMERTAALIRLG
jgi:hypothetical protein